MCIDSVSDGTCDGIIDSTCPSVDFKSLCFSKWICMVHRFLLNFMAN
jgi:hypothetical protein